jgi:hypothetical protein
MSAFDPEAQICRRKWYRLTDGRTECRRSSEDEVAQTSCPKCLALISADATECPVCGATEASLSAEAASARAHQVPSSKPSIFRWKRESVAFLIVILIGWAVIIAIRIIGSV